jgi:signal peptidase II
MNQENKKPRRQESKLTLLLIFLFSCFLVFLFALDRLTKFFFITNPNYFHDLWLFKLNLVINPHIAFGLAVPQVLILFLVSAILTVLIYLLIRNYKNNNFKLFFILGLIITGALSNLLDRVEYGGVIDFIDMPYFTVFNLADVYIFFGVGLWLLIENRKVK